MSLQQLAIQNLRNIKRAEIKPVSGLNLIYGDNAAGKTSVLEAIHVLATARSFRTLHADQIINHEKESLIVTRVQESNIGLDKIGIERSKSGVRLRLNGQDINKTSLIAQKLPLQIINPEAHRLLEQGPKIRRKMLDWGVFHVEQQFAEIWRTYNRVLRQRNSALRQANAKIAVILNPQMLELANAIDGMRSALGLAVENMYAYGVVLDTEIAALDENNQESIEMLRDMEGEIYSTVPAVCEANGLEPITIEELGEKLRDMTVVIPYGTK